MARSNNSFLKKLREQKKKKKKQEKEERKAERKKNATTGELDNMIAYVDEYGNISSEPPVEVEIKKKTL